MAASSGSSLRCESILDRGRNSEYHEGRGENRGVVDSQDRLVVVHAGVEQGLDHSEGEFGVLGAGGSIPGLFFGRIVFSILSIRTAEQSTMQNSQQQRHIKEDGTKMGKPQVPQLLRGFHQEGDLVWVIAPLRDPTQIQENDGGLIKPLGMSTKVKIVISMEIQVNQIGERYCEREK